MPLICDADTGYGNQFNVTRTVQEFERDGLAGIHSLKAQWRRPHPPSDPMSITVRPRIFPPSTSCISEGSSLNGLTRAIAARWRGRRSVPSRFQM